MDKAFFVSLKNGIIKVLSSQKVNMMMTFVIIFVATYISVMTVFGRNLRYPTSNPEQVETKIDERLVHIILSLLLLLFFSLSFSQILHYFRINKMIGSLLFGVVIANVPSLDEFFFIPTAWDSAVRRFALVNIVIKWGLSINLQYLSSKLMPTLMVGVGSVICETACITAVFHLCLGTQFFIALIIGCVLATASAPVAAPTVAIMKEKKLGTERHISDVIPASICIDNIFCILVYSITSSLFFTTDSLIPHFLVDVGAIVLLCAIGTACGFILWRFPHQEAKHSSLARFCVIVSVPTAFIWGMMTLGFQFAGIAGSLCLLSVAHHYWKVYEIDRFDHCIDNVSHLYRFVSAPLLFSLVGRKLHFHMLTWEFLRVLLFAILLGYLIRFLSTMFFAKLQGLCLKEQMVVGMALIPKASVQCALAPFASVFGDAFPEYKDDLRMMVDGAVISVVISVCLIDNLLEYIAPRVLEHENHQNPFDVITENGKTKSSMDGVRTFYLPQSTIGFNSVNASPGSSKPEKMAVIRLHSNELGRVHPNEQPASSFGLH